MYDNSQSSSRSFNNSELSKGFHLLTESSHNVTVNTPSVPAHSAHLYPRLAGSNWTCYLSQPSVILGRSGTMVPPRTTRQKQPPPAQLKVGVDFGSSMAISRKHCEVRFSFRRDRWELYVYGRNGVKVNHIPKRSKDRPVVLTTGSLIEINNTTFVFILPNKYVKPKSSLGVTEEVSEVDRISNHVEDAGLNPDLEVAVINILEKNSGLNTTDIFNELKKTYTHPLEKENILHLLVLSNRFQLAPNSISMSSKEADSVKWMLIPKSKNDNSTQDSSKTTAGLDISSSEMSIVAPSPVLEKNIGKLSTFESTDDMSITSIAAVEGSNAPFSIRSTYSNEDEMSISAPSTTQNTPVLNRNKHNLSRMESGDDMSITSTTATGEPSLPFSISFKDGIMFRTPSSLSSILPPLHENQEPRIPTPSASFAKFFEGDAGWSVFLPDSTDKQQDLSITATESDTQTQTQSTTKSSVPAPAPILLRTMSIESMYTVWSSSSLCGGDGEFMDHDDTRPRKKAKTSVPSSKVLNGDSLSLIRGTSTDTEPTIKKPNIYADVHTKILY